MWREWYEQFRVKVLWLFVRLVRIKPFLRIDPNAYCPACGATKGRIIAVTDGQQVNIRHLCAICQWLWDEATVTKIDPASIPKDIEDVEESDEEKAKPHGKFERFVQIKPGDIRVNKLPISGGVNSEGKK